MLLNHTNIITHTITHAVKYLEAMSTATPVKRRALGALNANALTRSPSRPSATKLDGLGKNAAMTPTPSPKKKKRALEDGDPRAENEVASPAFKKLCSATAAKTAASPAKRVVAAASAAVAVKPEPAGQDAEEVCILQQSNALGRA